MGMQHGSSKEHSNGAKPSSTVLDIHTLKEVSFHESGHCDHTHQPNSHTWPPPPPSPLTKVLEVFRGDKLVVVVDGWFRVLLQLLSQCVQEGAPARGLAQELGEGGYMAICRSLTNFVHTLYSISVNFVSRLAIARIR